MVFMFTIKVFMFTILVLVLQLLFTVAWFTAYYDNSLRNRSMLRGTCMNELQCSVILHDC
jgi:hypothetical protein